MYNSHNLAIMIKSRAKEKNIAMKDLLIACSLGSNTMSALYHGKSIAFDSLAKIADELDCSVDYLLGRTENPEMYRQSLKHASVKLKEDEEALLNEWRKLSIENQTYIRDKINTLNEASEYNLDKSSTNEAFGA